MILTKGMYRWGMIFRITGLLIICILMVYVALATYFWLISLWLALLLVLQAMELIRYAERSRTELISFLTSISQNDYSGASLLTEKSKHRDELKYVLNSILETFTRLRDEKEKNYQYLKTLVEHISIAIVCFSDNYKVELFNKAAQQLFQKRALSSLKSFERIDEALALQIFALRSNQRSLIKLIIGNELLNLSILATEFKIGEVRFKIVSFQDIRSELDEKEIDSWQKLISVISHEISNSVIPISTLSHTLREMVEESNDSTLPGNMFIPDIVSGLKSIELRSKGLAEFVQSTKRLRQITNPDFNKVSCKEIFEQVSLLISPTMKEKKIIYQVSLSPGDIILLADKKMIEQTIINLLLNAIDASENMPGAVVSLSGFLSDDNHAVITVSDKGSGIEPENLDKIFVPYFTTKRHGMGIGLSLARQIMHLHKGNITVRSSPGTVTEFILKF